ncbi:hypothetical protein H0H93_012872, partial [Arthromyces matolae]
MSAVLKIEKFELATKTHGTTLISTMKRYTRASVDEYSAARDEPRAILLLGHGAGFPKETWEPTIEDLFGLDDSIPLTETMKRSKTGGGLRVREAWALDCQNHGQAAIVNAETLVKDPSILSTSILDLLLTLLLIDIEAIYDYADSFATLYNSGLLGKLDPKFDKVILVGHSAGTVGVTLATSYFNPPSRLPFASLILIDPPIFASTMKDHETEMYKLVAAMTPIRKDRWPSQEAAVKWMEKRVPWNMWDRRVFDAFTKYGLQPLPTPYYPDKQGVTLSTHRSGENNAFTGEIFSFHALHRLSQICNDIPVHLIYGGVNDMFDHEVQDSIVDPKEGRNFASITRLKGVGHL